MAVDKYRDDGILHELCAQLGVDTDDDGIEELRKAVRESVNRRSELSRAARIQAIASYISPVDHRDAGREERQRKRHPLLPKWWWNGCDAEEADGHWGTPKGHTAVTVKSYIGGGEEGEETVYIPDVWIEAPGDSWKVMVDADAEEKNRQLDAADREKRRQEALRKIESARAELDGLEDTQP